MLIQVHKEIISAATTSTTPAPPREVVWKPPTNATLNLNMDGSAIGNPGPSGFRGLIRNNIGDWIIGFVGHYGYATNLFAELTTIHQGLQLIWRFGHHDVVCESDCKTTLHLICDANTGYHPYTTIINKIKDYRSKPRRLHFCHILREGNKCVGALAMIELSHEDNFVQWDTPPH
ncbi:hypothetical protein JHK82_053091 [Glycine max]|nr:hypothetical protein JHK86_052937 [Glycine max]KAG4927310.1 hypothetical protein JHK85_053796 [Glycine max]KAG5082927.1 hypothetical protein JHK84_052965 [Glycine max]KAG5085694.1 hypothetical protein JHK82_053091 [Glycine max]